MDLLVSIKRKLWKGHCRIGVTNWKVGLWRLRGLNLTSMGNDNVNDKWKESDNQNSLILDMIHWYNWHLLAGVLYGDIQTYHCQSDVEQTAHVFLEQQGRRKSQRKIKGRCQ